MPIWIFSPFANFGKHPLYQTVCNYEAKFAKSEGFLPPTDFSYDIAAASERQKVFFYQVSLQLALLLLTQTKTATVGGLETFFTHDEMFGLAMAPETIIILSVFWSLKTSTMLHVKTLSLEKGYFGFKVVRPNSS